MSDKIGDTLSTQVFHVDFEHNIAHIGSWISNGSNKNSPTPTTGDLVEVPRQFNSLAFLVGVKQEIAPRTPCQSDQMSRWEKETIRESPWTSLHNSPNQN
ncbi:hypothetical protein E8E14_006997 [Neopestalotiopsis sp. 37M]|nr:hypothetical protein E8E14_006997 [Neopestalotiopsis sp. 37M]